MLYRTCGYHELIPQALVVVAHFGQTGSVTWRGGFADVWKGEYLGQAVAIKVLQTYSDDILQKVFPMSCWL